MRKFCSIGYIFVAALLLLAATNPQDVGTIYWSQVLTNGGEVVQSVPVQLGISLSQNQLFFTLRNMRHNAEPMRLELGFTTGGPKSYDTLSMNVVDETGQIQVCTPAYQYTIATMPLTVDLPGDESHTETVDLSYWNDYWKKQGQFYLKPNTQYLAFFQYSGSINGSKYPGTVVGPVVAIKFEGDKFTLSSYADFMKSQQKSNPSPSPK